MTPPTADNWPRLLRELRYAQQHIPLYRELWARAGVDMQALREPADFTRLPLLTRRDLHEAGVDARLAPRYPASALRPFSTSGSSGEPLALLLDPRTRRRRQLRFFKALWRCGYRPGQSLMLISSRPSGSVQRVSPLARLLGWHYVDLYAGAAQMATDFLRIRPTVLYGPQQALLLLAAALNRGEGIAHRPRLLISTSEQLSAAAERHLRDGFGTAVTDFYGLTECGLVAWRPPGHCGYDVAHEDLHLEFFAQAETPGYAQLAVTDLTGGSMPLYRYLTGDLVRLDVGAAGSSIVEFAGKQLDSLRLPDGGRIVPYLIDEALSGVEGLIRYQVIQQPDLSIQLRIEARTAAALPLACAALNALCDNQLAVQAAMGFPDDLPLAHKARPIISHAPAP